MFGKNIETLKTVDRRLAEAITRANSAEDISIITSKKGLPSLKIGNITLHSLYDPAKEAEDWIRYYHERIRNTSSIIIFGFGLGHHIIELSKVVDADLIVYEPRLDILKTAFEYTDFTYLFPRLRIMTGYEIPETGKDFIILEHKPSVSLNPDYFEKIRLRLKAGLRIMVVSPIYGGSFPIAQFCENALRNLGYKVDFVDNSIYKEALLSIDRITSNKTHQGQLREMLINFASEAIIARCNEFKPALILALAQAPLTAGSLQKLNHNKIPTAFWFVEDFRLMEYWQGVAPLYDYFFTIQRGEFLDRLKERGVKNSSYLPLAAPPDIHKEVELAEDELKTYGSDVSFVGAGYRNRRKFFEGLLDLDFKIWGNEWDLNSPVGRCIQRSGKRIDTEEIVKIFNAAKININLHSSTYHNGVNPYGDFVNPRTFEILACGGFQLVDHRSLLPELFEIDKEIVCFKDINDLRDKIQYYLKNPEEREDIAIAGRARVLREHTYEQRMKEMLDFIFENGYELPEWKPEAQDVDVLIDAAKDNKELKGYLERFINKGSIGIKDIIIDIQSGDGNLSRVEKVFLLADAMERDFRKRD